MANNGITIQGLPGLLKDLSKLSTELKEEVDAECEAACQNIVRDAKQRAPVDQGFLRNNISYRKLADANYEVVSAAGYSAYQEFGTRSFVQVPSGLESFAAQFKGQGGRGPSIHPQPFFFPAVNQETPKLIERIKRIITNP